MTGPGATCGPRAGDGQLVTVVLITWNSARFVDPCLGSLSEALRGIDARVLAVDNGSADDTVARLAAWPGVEIIRNRRNRGVARARNQGLRRARTPYVLLLDIDTIVEPDAVRRLLAFMELRPHAGLVGPRLLSPRGDLQYTCRRFPTVLTKIARRSPGPLREALLVREEMRGWDHATVARVDYMIGACQLIRRSALLEVGLLDESMFYGPEDIDLCLRMWRTGWEVYYQPAATVTHDQQRMSRGLLNPLLWRHALALWRYFRKHRYWISRRAVYRRLGWTRRRPQVRWGLEVEPADG